MLAILTAYGRALDQIIDPHITQTVLKSLQSLHERWKLFDREFFKANLLELYLYTLFKVLLSHNGILYYDQLIAVLFNMGQSNVAMLHSTFVSFGYSHDAKNVEEICLAKVIFQYLDMLFQFKHKIYISFFFTFFKLIGFSNILNKNDAVGARCKMRSNTITQNGFHCTFQGIAI